MPLRVADLTWQAMQSRLAVRVAFVLGPQFNYFAVQFHGPSR